MENFNEVYNKYSEDVFNFLNKKLFYKDSELARDLTNDTMLKVYNKLDSFDGDKSSMRTWINTIAKNVLIDYSRKRKLDTTSMSNFVDDEGKPTLDATSETTPLSEIINTQIGESVQLAFNKLPEMYRKYADLFFNKQLSYDEIATELNTPLGSVKSYIFRTRQMLQESLNIERV